MFPTSLLLASFIVAMTGRVSAAATPVDDSSLVAELITANTQVNRVKGVGNDANFVFNFLDGARGTGAGGFAISANSANFPALFTGNGAMTVGVVGPCGVSSPHTHPRATEIVIVVQGGPIYTEFIMENGASPVRNTVPLGSATIFPMGSIHFGQNMGCEPTIFIASFDNINPGTSQIAQNFFALNQGVVDATLGEVGVSFLDHLKLPDNFILGAQECLDRCKIDRSTFNFTASFKDYQIFSNSTRGQVPELPASVSSMYAAKSTASSKRSLAGANALEVRGSLGLTFDNNPLRGTVIGLGTTTGVLVLAVIGLLVVLARRRQAGIRAAAQGDKFITVARGYPYAAPYNDHGAGSTDKFNH